MGAEGDEAAPQAKPAVVVADEAEVERVLAASTDYAVLQVPAGTSGAELRRRFREMAISLHPDKCKVGVSKQSSKKSNRVIEYPLQSTFVSKYGMCSLRCWLVR